MRARDTLFLGQRAQNDAGCLRRFDRDFGRCDFWLRCFNWRRFGFRLGCATDGAAFDLLDDDLLAAAMAEALAHHARFRARLQRQSEFLLARGLGFAHSVLFPCAPSTGAFNSQAPSAGALALTASGKFPVRKRVKRATRARNVSLPGPASRAACTTFERFNAKSNSAPEKASIIAISRGSAAVSRCNAPINLRLPSSAASDA